MLLRGEVARCGGHTPRASLAHNGVLRTANNVVRQSVSLPANVAARVRSLRASPKGAHPSLFQVPCDVVFRHQLKGNVHLLVDWLFVDQLDGSLDRGCGLASSVLEYGGVQTAGFDGF